MLIMISEVAVTVPAIIYRRRVRCCFLSQIDFLFLADEQLNTMLTVDKRCSDVCCDEFPVPQTDRKSKRTVAWKILFAISSGKDMLY